MKEIPDFDLDVLATMMVELGAQSSVEDLEKATAITKTAMSTISTLSLILSSSEGFIHFNETEIECYESLAQMASYTEECIMLEKYQRMKLATFNYDKISYENILSENPVDIEFVDLEKPKNS